MSWGAPETTGSDRYEAQPSCKSFGLSALLVLPALTMPVNLICSDVSKANVVVFPIVAYSARTTIGGRLSRARLSCDAVLGSL
jgi:hypothetical protein